MISWLTFPLVLLTPLLLQTEKKPIVLVIRHVTVVDAPGSAPQPDCTVVIAGERIASIGKGSDVPVPKDAQELDGTGKFLIPGLWDMHVHLMGQGDFALCLANGVTGVRDMYNPLSPFPFWKKQIAEGKIVGPRIWAAHTMIDGPRPIWPLSKEVRTDAEARQAV